MAETVETKIKDVATEMLVIGSLYKKPLLLLDYGDLIKSKYDFADETAKFLYNAIYELYLMYSDNNIDEAKINIFMNQDAKRKEYYKKIKGYQTIKRAMDLADEEKFKKYYDDLKKYSLLRELSKKGFPSQKIIDRGNFHRVTPEQVIEGMEYQLNTIMTEVGGIQDSILLGSNMVERYNEWKKNPDFGEEIPFPILNRLIRGWRKKKLLLAGMHSGCGKSRMTSKIVTYLGIKKKVPICLLINEQDEDEWNAMILSSVVNNPEYGFVQEYWQGVDETTIVTGTCNPKEDALCQKAAEWIQENTQIYFLEMNRFTANDLKRQIKRHKLKGIDYFVYDTMKAPDHDWQSFVKTGDMLKDIAQELNVGIWATFQLTDDSLFSEMLTSQAIAIGKHVKHIADGLFMFRPMFNDEYDKYNVLIPGDEFNDKQEIGLDRKSTHYICWVDKNRGGKDKDRLVFKVDKGKNYWEEIGYLVESEELKEIKRTKKEYKHLKQLKETRKMKEQLQKSQ